MLFVSCCLEHSCRTENVVSIMKSLRLRRDGDGVTNILNMYTPHDFLVFSLHVHAFYLIEHETHMQAFE